MGATREVAPVKHPAVRVVLALVALAVLGVVGFRVFEHFEQGGIKKDAGRACGDLDTPTGSATVPAALSLPLGQKLLRVQTQGKTAVVFASVQGGRDDILSVRESVLTSLKGQGYTVKGTDQEPGIEAEAELEGTASGTLRVKPLCTDRLEIRYKMEG